MTDQLPERIWAGKTILHSAQWTREPTPGFQAYILEDTAVPRAEIDAMLGDAYADGGRVALEDCAEKVADAVEAERASWEPVADALWQLLDDMGLDGQCVCLAAKEEAKSAYMGKVNGLFPDNLDVLPAAIRAPQESSE